MRIAQSHQNRYIDKRRRDLSFKVGDFVYLKVSPMRATRRFKVNGKLTPGYIGPFQVLDHKGDVSVFFLHRQDIRWSRSRVPILRWSCKL
jgi:hypothetical protein